MYSTLQNTFKTLQDTCFHTVIYKLQVSINTHSNPRICIEWILWLLYYCFKIMELAIIGTFRLIVL